MSARWTLTLFVALTLTASTQAAPPIAGGWYNLFDDVTTPPHGPVQLAGFSCGRASDKPDDVACAVYLGIDVAEYDRRTIVDIADQVFDEMMGFDCARRSFKSDQDGKSRPIPHCVIYVGDVIIRVRDEQEFKRSLLRGARERDETRVDYAIKKMPPGALEGSAFYATEYVRDSQLEFSVGPSHREPNKAVVQTVIEPGVVIELEGTTDVTYFDERKPHLLVKYRTKIPVADKAANQALAEKVVQALAGPRLSQQELSGVRVSAYNEPKRSRFHFRPVYRYDADAKGNVLPQ